MLSPIQRTAIVTPTSQQQTTQHETNQITLTRAVARATGMSQINILVNAMELQIISAYQTSNTLRGSDIRIGLVNGILTAVTDPALMDKCGGITAPHVGVYPRRFIGGIHTPLGWAFLGRGTDIHTEPNTALRSRDAVGIINAMPLDIFTSYAKYVVITAGPRPLISPTVHIIPSDVPVSPIIRVPATHFRKYSSMRIGRAKDGIHTINIQVANVTELVAHCVEQRICGHDAPILALGPAELVVWFEVMMAIDMQRVLC